MPSILTSTEAMLDMYLYNYSHFANALDSNLSTGNLFHLLTNDSEQHRLLYQPSKLISLVVSIVSLLLNLCSLLAITRVQGLLTTNLRLLISLCLSDMLISACVVAGVIDIPPATCHVMGRRSLKMTSHVISLLNLLGLAFDHYFAVIRPLSYAAKMCPRRTNIMIGVFWLLAVAIGFSDFYIPLFPYRYCSNQNETMTYCERVWCTAYDSEYIVIAMAILLLVIMMFIYARIYHRIRQYTNFEGRHQRFVQRTRRGLGTTMLVLGSFMFCWLPYCLFQTTFSIQMLLNVPMSVGYLALSYRLDMYLYNLLLLNCLLDPLIYAVRMGEVRRGFRRWVLCLRQKRTVLLVVRFTQHRQSAVTGHRGTVDLTGTTSLCDNVELKPEVQQEVRVTAKSDNIDRHACIVYSAGTKIPQELSGCDL